MSHQTADYRVGFIGAGRMATALTRGLLTARFTRPDAVIAADVLPEARERFAAETGAQTAASNAEVAGRSDVLVLAVKPQHMGTVLDEMKAHVTSQQLVISIAAGIPLKTLIAAFGEDCRIVRVMPNTPCLVGAGASAFALGGRATQDDAQLVQQMLSTVGIALEVPESQLDAVTGLSGSGPAFVYQMIEALSDGGVRVGLPRETAARLAAQTVYGAAQMVLQTGEHPGVLKDAVASPGGTTIAGLHELERGGLRSCLMNAVEAATSRSRELGELS